MAGSSPPLNTHPNQATGPLTDPPSGSQESTSSAGSLKHGRPPLAEGSVSVGSTSSKRSLRLPPRPHAEPNMNGLPDELLDAIIRHMQAQQDVYSLHLVSKRFNAVAIPHLYRNVKHEMYVKPQRLHQLLHNIITKPELASYIQRIDLEDQKSCESFYNLATWRLWASSFYDPKLSQENIELFENAARELRLQNIDALDVIAQKEEAQAALLISRAVNVVELRMTIPDLNQARLLVDILRETTDQGTALQRLRKFTGEYYNFEGNVEGGFQLAPISCLFRLPSIEVVNGVACLEPEDAAFRSFDCPEGESTVVEIDFRRSSICPKAMSLMVGACRALKVFKCDWGGHTVGWSEINFPMVGAALRKQHASLESLTLDVRKHYDVWPESEDVLIPPLGDFRGFERLTCIEAPSAALTGWDEGRVGSFPPLHEILPQSLETLYINQWAPGIMESMQGLASRWPGVCHNLHTIKIQEAPSNHRGEPSEAEVRSLFNAVHANVDVSFIDCGEVDHFS